MSKFFSGCFGTCLGVALAGIVLVIGWFIIVPLLAIAFME